MGQSLYARSWLIGLKRSTNWTSTGTYPLTPPLAGTLPREFLLWRHLVLYKKILAQGKCRCGGVNWHRVELGQEFEIPQRGTVEKKAKSTTMGGIRWWIFNARVWIMNQLNQTHETTRDEVSIAFFSGGKLTKLQKLCRPCCTSGSNITEFSFVSTSWFDLRSILTDARGDGGATLLVTLSTTVAGEAGNPVFTWTLTSGHVASTS